jgi:hypothetical protein
LARGFEESVSIILNILSLVKTKIETEKKKEKEKIIIIKKERIERVRREWKIKRKKR